MNKFINMPVYQIKNLIVLIWRHNVNQMSCFSGVILSHFSGCFVIN